MTRIGAAMMVGALALGGCTGNSGAGGTGLFVSDRTKVPATGLILISGDIARQLDDRDKALIVEAQGDALDSGSAGTPLDWSNPATGRSGSITPGAVYTVNQYTCRDFTQKLQSGTKSETARGTACKHPDGSWRTIS